jgi:ATPase family associated with various cellular activities (AAA)/AAA lid domain
MPGGMLDGFWGLAALYGALAGGGWVLRDGKYRLLNAAMGLGSGALAAGQRAAALKAGWEQRSTKRFADALEAAQRKNDPLEKMRRQLEELQKDDHPLIKQMREQERLKKKQATSGPPAASITVPKSGNENPPAPAKGNGKTPTAQAQPTGSHPFDPGWLESFMARRRGKASQDSQGAGSKQAEAKQSEERFRRAATERNTSADKQEQTAPVRKPAKPPVLDDARRYAERKSELWASESRGIQKLKGLIGLEGVKVQVEMVSNLAWVDTHRKSKKMRRATNTYHMVFAGNPGTGKTTVARIVAEIFREMGVLSKGQLVEVTRKDLGSQYWGSGNEMTAAVIEKALDGVLFIDEAYALHKGLASGHGDAIGDEIVTTLLAEMENKRDRLIVIAAGYKMEMEQFMDTNPGLKSRFKTIIDFPDYTPAEMFEIFEKLCADDEYILAGGAHIRAEQVIEAMHATKGKHFGNGRDVRNLFDACRARQATRLRAQRKTGRSDLMTLIADDIGPEPKKPKDEPPQAAQGEGHKSNEPEAPPVMPPPRMAEAKGKTLLKRIASEAGKSNLEREREELEKENEALMQRLIELGDEVEQMESRKDGEDRGERKDEGA